MINYSTIEMKVLERDSPVIKSTEISVQGLVGMKRGISFLASGFDNPFVKVHI